MISWVCFHVHCYSLSLPTLGHAVSWQMKGSSNLAQPKQGGNCHVSNEELLRVCILEAWNGGFLLWDIETAGWLLSGKSRRQCLRNGRKTMDLKDSTGVTPYSGAELAVWEAGTKQVGSNKQTLYLQCPDIFMWLLQSWCPIPFCTELGFQLWVRPQLLALRGHRVTWGLQWQTAPRLILL